MTTAQTEQNMPSNPCFSTMAKEFEKTHCKIMMNGCYVEQREDGTIVIRSSRKLMASFGHMSCCIKGKKVNFIKNWIKNNNEIRIYERMHIYTNPAMCPPNVLNLWRPVGIEIVEEFLEKLNIYNQKPYYLLTNDRLLLR
jgi:hypothetical protein